MAVAGYMVTESATPPDPAAPGWSGTPPASYTFSAQGMMALYAWAKDAAGNVSIPWSDMVDVIVTDTTAPDVMSFTLPALSDSLIVPIQSFTALDDVEATSYMVTRTATPPTATATGWSATPQTSYTFPPGTSGTQILYGWAKDAAGNVSDSLTDQTVLTISDRTLPTVTSFSIPTTSQSLTVPILRFTAADNKVVAGYMVTTTTTAPPWISPNWTATAPTNYTFTSAGAKTLYPWVRDGSGNVSRLYSGRAMRVVISLGEHDDD